MNERIIGALDLFGDPTVPSIYTGKAVRYYTFNYELVPTHFVDNCPLYYRALIQVHYFCPLEADSVQRRSATAQAIVRAGFAWPEVIDASDKETQHFVFETEIIIKTEE